MKAELADRLLRMRKRREGLQKELAQAEASVALHTKTLKEEFGVADVAGAEKKIKQLEKKQSKLSASLETLREEAEAMLGELEALQ